MCLVLTLSLTVQATLSCSEGRLGMRKIGLPKKSRTGYFGKHFPIIYIYLCPSSSCGCTSYECAQQHSLDVIVHACNLPSYTYRFAVLVSEAVGLDWVLLFLHANTHTDTVSRALRLLVQLLSIERLQQRFHEGEIFGPWVKGFENLPPDISTLLETSMTQVNPLKPQSQFPLPGAPILSRLLPHHLHSPQVFLLMIAFLLGKTGLSIPFSASFTMETLDNVFQVGDTVIMTNVRLCPDAAFVLLAMARVLLHQVNGTLSHVVYM